MGWMRSLKVRYRRRAAIEKAISARDLQPLIDLLRESPDELQPIVAQAQVFLDTNAPWYCLLLCVALSTRNASAITPMLSELLDLDFPGWKQLTGDHIQFLSRSLQNCGSPGLYDRLLQRLNPPRVASVEPPQVPPHGMQGSDSNEPT